MLLVGDSAVCGTIAQLIDERKYLHTHVVGYVTDDVNTGMVSGLKHLSETKGLLKTIKQEGIDQVVVASPSVGPALMKDLLDCMKQKVRVTDFRHLIEYVTGKVPIEHLSTNWFIEELAGIDQRYTWFVKRSLDILFSIIGGVLSFPILLLAAAAIKLDSSGPVFYSQIRIGRGERKFRVWKLRTMVSDADKSKVFWTEDNDDRITRIGRFLRKTHVDELPQLINILSGDMSLIGPRPEAEALVEMYSREIPFYSERHMITPGVTGWAQINYPYGNSIEDAREKLKYDYYYIKNRSVLLDLLILLRTIRTVMTGKGAL
jgi:exopolysaccharide biosynthesis polyprenyl glycosylphosphotransferase